MRPIYVVRALTKSSGGFAGMGVYKTLEAAIRRAKRLKNPNELIWIEHRDFTAFNSEN